MIALLLRLALVAAAALSGSVALGRRAGAAVSDGAAITPQFAEGLYAKLAALREADGCVLKRFDTSRFRIDIGLQTRSGTEHVLELATAPPGGAPHQAGEWALVIPPELARDCGATVASIERVLGGTGAPAQEWWAVGSITMARANYALLVGSIVLLVLGTGRILHRELKTHRPSPIWVLALLLVWATALALRLSLSPRTFLHEYFHIAETAAAYFAGQNPPAYGNTGPVLFHSVATLLGKPKDVQVIFLTNAVVASLAIPAVALLDLALFQSWPRALSAAVLLCVLPQHLRYSAAEDLFIQAVTFGLWALGVFALYLRTGRLGDGLLAALALAVAMQTRPEMIFFPAVLAALVVLAQPGSPRVLFSRRTVLAGLLLGAMLIPRSFDLYRALQSPSLQTPQIPPAQFVRQSLVLLQPEITPRVYWAFLALGLAWGAWRKPGHYAWMILVYAGYTLLSLTLLGTLPFHLRTQLLTTGFVVLAAAGSAALWMELFGRSRRALALGGAALAVAAIAIVVTSRPFVTEMFDQQLEWAFVERTAPRLPLEATLVSAIEPGGRKLDAFPTFLLPRASAGYRLVDVRLAIRGEATWPAPGDDVLFYQGLFCYFAFDDEPVPDPMSAPCRVVHERYVAEPLITEDIAAPPYSPMIYARDGRGPFRIGFYRLKAGR